MAKKATEIRDEIFEISKKLHQLSNDLTSDIELDGIDMCYINAKFVGDIKNVSTHIEGQLKHLVKQETQKNLNNKNKLQ